MGKASRRKRINSSIKISDGSEFLEYFLSPKSEGDLLPLTDDLIEKLVIQEKIPKDDLLRLANEGFLYSTVNNNFVLLIQS